jgi:uroporphyrinogen-III synthase
MIKGPPLLDKKILVPRGKQQAKSFSQLVEKYGGIPVEIPLISFRPVKKTESINPIVDNLDTYDWVIFTSNVTVETFTSFVEKRHFTSLPKVAVIGERTKKVLMQHGIHVDFVPSEYVAETFVAEFLPLVKKGARILIPKGNLARDYIADTLRKHDAYAEEIIVYETFLPAESRVRLSEMLSNNELDVLLFTSPSTVDHLMSVVEEDQLHVQLGRCIIGCIGPVTHEKIRSWGLPVHITPNVYTVEEMVKKTVDYFEDNFGG